jgi:hypothetical protein
VCINVGMSACVNVGMRECINVGMNLCRSELSGVMRGSRRVSYDFTRMLD